MSAFQKSRGTEAKAGAVDTCDDWGKGRKLETYIIALLYLYTHTLLQANLTYKERSGFSGGKN